jgi:protocatechuate 3,4-dioxygenase alpha subunit
MDTQERTPTPTVDPFSGFALPYAGGPVIAEDGAGEAIPDALIEVLQADPGGQFHEDGFEGFGRRPTRPEGRFTFTTVKPGPVGPGKAPYLGVDAHGLLVHPHTRLNFPDEPEANAPDPGLRAVPEDRRHTLIGAADGLRFDIRPQGDEETMFFDI